MTPDRKDQVISLAGVLALAILLPSLLKGANGIVRYLAGAEGRLAAIGVETNRTLGPLPMPWQGLAQGGKEVKTFLAKDLDKVGQLNPGLVRIDHIYDEFNVVRYDNGNLVFDWNELDKTVERIASTGAKPMLALSYMPQAISKGDIFDEPRDWNDWKTVVRETIKHYSGEKNIEGMYYEVWNEPDLMGEWKMGGKKDYKNLYLYAARGSEEVGNVAAYSFGGPATAGLDKNWVDSFFPFILQNKLRLDFFSWHRYDPHIGRYTQDVEEIDAIIDGHPYFSKIEKIVSEYGSDSKNGGANDDKEGAAHLVSVMRELMFRVKYGMTSSVEGQRGILDKPRFWALKMLSSLGKERLSTSGEGTWVKAIAAKKDGIFQVILTNYDPQNTHSESVPVTFLNLNERNYKLRRSYLDGQTLEENIATTEAVLQREIPMTPNSVVMLELQPITDL